MDQLELTMILLFSAAAAAAIRTFLHTKREHNTQNTTQELEFQKTAGKRKLMATKELSRRYFGCKIH